MAHCDYMRGQLHTHTKAVLARRHVYSRAGLLNQHAWDPDMQLQFTMPAGGACMPESAVLQAMLLSAV
jgi:hypothetical protein